MTRTVALLLTVLTGFTGLVYEVAWQKYLATLLGSHSEATAAVLGLFLAGLSLGYALFGRVTAGMARRARAAGRHPRLLLLYGIVEGSIGLWALAFPWLFEGVRAVSFLVPHEAGGLGFLFDVGLGSLLVLPPTVMMGGTIPILTQALARSHDDATRFHAFVYAFNTLGAFAGALLAGFHLVPALGLIGVLRAMGLVNLGAGAVFLALSTQRPVVVPAPERAGPAPGGTLLLAVVALLSGFAMMAIQTVLNRLGALSFGASQFTFSMVVAVFVLCIAIGSFLVSALPRIPRWIAPASQWALFALLVGLYPRLSEAPYWAHLLRSVFRDADVAFLPYHVGSFLGLLAVIGPPVVLSGALLPLLFHLLRGDAAELGGAAGRLYAWNTVGSLLGALLGGYLLLFWLELHHVYRIAVAAVALGAALLTVRVVERAPLLAGAVPAAVALLGLVVIEPWDPRLLSSGLFRHRELTAETSSGPRVWTLRRHSERLRFYDDDPTASVAVFEYPLGGGRVSRAIATNGKIDGNTKIDYPTQALAGIVPSLLADKVERAFVIGFGTGITVGELKSIPTVEEVVVAEISSAVLDAAPLFDFANRNVTKSPKVRMVRSDAYRALIRSEQRFDVIVSEPSNPWMTGVEMLFSKEFLETARSRLAEGGVYVQWYHQYETDAEAVSLVLRTYTEVFDEVAVWYGMGPDLLLLGFADDRPEIDLDALERRAALPDRRRALRRSGIESFPALLAHELVPIGVLHRADLEGGIHTLYHPRLNHVAGLAFFRGGRTELPFTGFGAAARAGREHSLLAALRERHGGRLPEPAREALVARACALRAYQCATLLAHWRADDPDSAALARLREEASQPALRFGGVVEPQTVEQLASLFPAGPDVGDGPSSVAPQLGDHLTDLYEEYYLHAAPFDPDELLAVWGRCREDARGRCQAGRARARVLLQSGGGEVLARRP